MKWNILPCTCVCVLACKICMPLCLCKKITNQEHRSCSSIVLENCVFTTMNSRRHVEGLNQTTSHCWSLEMLQTTHENIIGAPINALYTASSISPNAPASFGQVLLQMEVQSVVNGDTWLPILSNKRGTTEGKCKLYETTIVTMSKVCVAVSVLHACWALANWLVQHWHNSDCNAWKVVGTHMGVRGGGLSVEWVFVQNGSKKLVLLTKHLCRFPVPHIGCAACNVVSLTGQQAAALRGASCLSTDTKETAAFFFSFIKHSTMWHLPGGDKRVDT